MTTTASAGPARARAVASASGTVRAVTADLAVLTRADHPRAADPAALARWTRGRPAVTARTVPEALATALALAGPADAVVVTGSFYVAGEALAALGYEG